MGNDIKALSAKELRCPNIVALYLGENEGLQEILEAFLLNLTSLRVLYFHGTVVRSLPTSLWQLTHLEFLFLGFIEIEAISDEIANLSSLQFLYLNFCKNLKSLSSTIGELQNLKYLNLHSCNLIEILDAVINLPNCEIVLKNEE